MLIIYASDFPDIESIINHWITIRKDTKVSLPSLCVNIHDWLNVHNTKDVVLEFNKNPILWIKTNHHELHLRLVKEYFNKE